MACRILSDQGSNPCLLHWQVDSLPQSHQEVPCSGFFFFNKWMKLWASCWLWARSCAIQYVSMFVTTIFYMGKWVGVCMYKWNECILDVSEFVIMCVFLSTQLWQYELSTATSCVWIVSHQVWRHVYMCEYICWYVLICKLVTQSCSTLWFHGL